MGKLNRSKRRFGQGKRAGPPESQGLVKPNGGLGGPKPLVAPVPLVKPVPMATPTGGLGGPKPPGSGVKQRAQIAPEGGFGLREGR